MGCERPGGPILDMVRDSHIKFPPNWIGDLPPILNRDQLRQQVQSAFIERNLNESQVNEVLDFLVEYEARYHEVSGGQCYHRECGGGAVVEGEVGVYCANCGKLPNLSHPLPECMR